MLGGFYLIISFPLGLFDNWILETMSAILLFALFIWAAVLLFRKPLEFLRVIKAKYPKSSIYLIFVGWTAYLIIPILVCGFILGYNAAMVAYEGEEYTQTAFDYVVGWLIIATIVAMIVSFVVATVMVVRRTLVVRRGLSVEK
jgi:hypothetical protein